MYCKVACQIFYSTFAQKKKIFTLSQTQYLSKITKKATTTKNNNRQELCTG